MGATNDGTKIILEGDGVGPCGARRAILAAPDESDIMYFFFRAYWDTISAEPSAVTYGWDHTFAFGLGFDNVFPSQANPPTFSRFLGDGNVYNATSFDLVYYATGGGTARPFIGLQNGSNYFYVGENDNTSHNNFTFAANASTSYTHPSYGAMEHVVFHGFPANPTFGLTVVQVWKIQRNTGSPQQVTVTKGINYESLAEANFSDARTSANTVWSNGFSFTAPDNFFPREAPMRFPTYLLMRNPDGVVGRKFIYDHGKVEFWKFTDEL